MLKAEHKYFKVPVTHGFSLENPRPEGMSYAMRRPE